MCITKYNTLTNEVMATYNTYKEASEDNNVSTSCVFSQCKHKRQPRKPYYFRIGEPCTHNIIACYNHDFELLGKYYSIEQASEETGVHRLSVIDQLNNTKELRNRVKGVTGLFFKYEEVI